MKRVYPDDIDDVRVSLVEYKIDKLPAGYDGFIDQDGNFFKVCESGDLSYVHDAFAEIFISIRHGKDIYKYADTVAAAHPGVEYGFMTPKDGLVQLFGYFSIQFLSNEIVLYEPEEIYNGFKTSNAQYRTLRELAKINGKTREYDIAFGKMIRETENNQILRRRKF